MRKLGISDGKDWSFLNGKWTDGLEGELIPPDGEGIEYVAVEHTHEYSDIRAKFRFKFRSHVDECGDIYSAAGGARFLFRLEDSMRYYALDIPWGGQQNRNRHFWAGIVLADGTPLQRYLHLGLVLGLCPEHDRWYEARVECLGTRIRAWIEGRPVVDIEDHTYATGRIGLMAPPNSNPETPHFADLQVSGTEVAPSPWGGLTQPPKHWITPCLEVDPEAYQSFPNLIMSKSGELTVSIPFGRPQAGEPRRTVWVRSKDGGRTWSDPQPATLQERLFGVCFVRKDGTWVCVHIQGNAKDVKEAFYTYESKDEGKTWTGRTKPWHLYGGPKPLNVQGEWPQELSLPAHLCGPALRLRDGTLLLPVGCNWSGGRYGGRISTDFVFRSTDDGETWEAPVRCDRDNSPDSRWFCPGDFSEIGLAEAADNVVVGFGRPGPWPYMWQVRSNDGGKTWEPAAFAPFPGYCISLTRTANGALVAVHRFPYLTANVSYDGGVTWDAGTIIDYPHLANHHAVEAEPDVVLVVYPGHYMEPGQADERILRLRVTGQGLVLDK